jgi:hypothetical protein
LPVSPVLRFLSATAPDFSVLSLASIRPPSSVTLCSWQDPVTRSEEPRPGDSPTCCLELALDQHRLAKQMSYEN